MYCPRNQALEWQGINQDEPFPEDEDTVDEGVVKELPVFGAGRPELVQPVVVFFRDQLSSIGAPFQSWRALVGEDEGIRARVLDHTSRVEPLRLKAGETLDALGSIRGLFHIGPS